jgi:hypothetical protein
MKRKLRDEWVAKLRDPYTKQRKGALETGTGNCCLGVLANICKIPKELVDGGFVNFKFDTGFQSTVLVPEGFHGLRFGDINNLTYKNDTGITFPQIADWIEGNILVEDENETPTT